MGADEDDRIVVNSGSFPGPFTGDELCAYEAGDVSILSSEGTSKDDPEPEGREDSSVNAPFEDDDGDGSNLDRSRLDKLIAGDGREGP